LTKDSRFWAACIINTFGVGVLSRHNVGEVLEEERTTPCGPAPKFDQQLRQSGMVALKLWQQEIRDCVSTAREPTFFAQKNLVGWGEQRGLVE
jgi:hypothetical protein